MAEANWSVGRVAKRCGIKISTLHFYETKGLISSSRNPGNQRRYKPDVLRRIAIIRAAQKMGISLAEIKRALSELPYNRVPSEQDWQKLSTRWRNELNARIRYMETLRDSFTNCIGCGCLSMTACPIYNANDKLETEGCGAVILDRDSIS